jgi:hypothetical protein
MHRKLAFFLNATARTGIVDGNALTALSTVLVLISTEFSASKQSIKEKWQKSVPQNRERGQAK